VATRSYAYGFLKNGNATDGISTAVVSELVPGGIYAFKVYQYADAYAGTNPLSVNGISWGLTTSSTSMEATAEGEATADGQGRITFTFTAQSDHVQLSGLAIGRCQTSKMNLINLKNDANLFSILCDGLQQVIEAALNKPDFSQVDYLIQILAFDDKLRIDNLRRFASMKVYDIFFEHYDVFHNNPLGFVRVFDGGTTVTYLHSNGGNAAVGSLLLPALLTDATRSYPMIHIDGRTEMVHYSSRQLFVSPLHISGDFFQQYPKVPNGGTLSLEAYRGFGITFYGANYDDLEANGGKMFGVPFLSKLPFDGIVSPLHPTGASKDEQEK